MVGPTSSQTAMSTDANEQHACVIGTVSASVNINVGLLPLQLVPVDVTTIKSLMMGEVLLNHACSYPNQTSGAEPSVYLDTAIDDRQMEVVAPTAEDLARGRLLQDVAMDSKNKMSKRKLNYWGIMTEHCRVINDKEGIKRTNDNLCLTATMYYINTK